MFPFPIRYIQGAVCIKHRSWIFKSINSWQRAAISYITVKNSISRSPSFLSVQLRQKGTKFFFCKPVNEFLGRFSEFNFFYISLYDSCADIKDTTVLDKQTDGSQTLPLGSFAAATHSFQPDQEFLHKLPAKTMSACLCLRDIFLILQEIKVQIQCILVDLTVLGLQLRFFTRSISKKANCAKKLFILDFHHMPPAAAIHKLQYQLFQYIGKNQGSYGCSKQYPRTARIPSMQTKTEASHPHLLFPHPAVDTFCSKSVSEVINYGLGAIKPSYSAYLDREPKHFPRP